MAVYEIVAFVPAPIYLRSIWAMRREAIICCHATLLDNESSGVFRAPAYI
jgi:hypothetical protein